MSSKLMSFTQGQTSSLEVNRVFKNTYLLLSLTLLFSGLMSGYAMSINAAPIGILALIVGMFGLYFLTMALRNSSWGIVAIFAYTGFMGYTLGPILNFYIQTFTNGAELIATALGATGAIFFSLTGYAMITRKNYSYLGGVISVAVLVAFLVGIGAAVFHLPAVQLIISGVFALISGGYILYTTSAIIHGGERNYIIATIMLYVAIFNLFTTLLHILGAFAGNRD